jgi:CRISPR type IV-associated protein Csf1
MLDKGPFIKSGFTNLDYLKAPGSPAICPSCAYVFTEPRLRQSSWLVNNEKMVWLKREDVWGVLLGSTPKIPFAMYVTTSWKKHGSFKARVNHDCNRFYVQFEETGVIFDRERWTAPARLMNLLYSIPKGEEEKKQPRSLFTKEMIRTGIYDQRRIRAFGMEELLEIEAILDPIRKQPAFGLLVYALNQTKLGREEKA